MECLNINEQLIRCQIQQQSENICVCVSLQRAQSELAAHQKKILHVDNHIGISIAGLTADARLLW